MKKDMTTFEMAQAAYENPGKVFVSGSRSVVWDGEELIHNQPPDGDGNPFVVNLYFWARRGYIWNEKVEPMRGTYEFEAQSNGLGVFTALPYKFVTDVLRKALAGEFGEYAAVADKQFKVTVYVEEVL